MKKKKPFPDLGLDLEKFVQLAPMPIVVADVKDEFRLILANDAYEKFFARPAQGKKLYDIFPIEEVLLNSKVFLTYVGVAKTKKPAFMHGWAYQLYDEKTKTHKTLYYDTYNSPVMDEENNVRYVVTIIVDITKSVENVELLRLERDLRDTFITGLGHDLTQPLSNAKFAAIKLIELLPVDSDISKLSKISLHGLERIETLFKALLDAYYLTATKSSWLKLSEFDPHDVTRSLLEVLTFTQGDRFKFVTKGKFKVYWDREGYMRIIENFLSNAVKYSKPETKITVSLVPSKSSVRISVHNVGPAIPLDEQGRLFRMFQKGSTGKGLKGWGLGLAIVRGIAEAHGGVSGVESHKKEGTTFFVDLPIKVILS